MAKITNITKLFPNRKPLRFLGVWGLTAWRGAAHSNMNAAERGFFREMRWINPIVGVGGQIVFPVEENAPVPQEVLSHKQREHIAPIIDDIMAKFQQQHNIAKQRAKLGQDFNGVYPVGNGQIFDHISNTLTLARLNSDLLKEFAEEIYKQIPCTLLLIDYNSEEQFLFSD
ncbi:MAG: hypothetical protein LBK69_06990 [Syntrophomonadaceae bacterium]|jgi:hypothetical protein|nr:hypothetical protein [Syntrophomonadaceae bacterium]